MAGWKSYVAAGLLTLLPSMVSTGEGVSDGSEKNNSKLENQVVENPTPQGDGFVFGEGELEEGGKFIWAKRYYDDGRVGCECRDKDKDGFYEEVFISNPVDQDLIDRFGNRKPLGKETVKEVVEVYKNTQKQLSEYSVSDKDLVGIRDKEYNNVSVHDPRFPSGFFDRVEFAVEACNYLANGDKGLMKSFIDSEASKNYNYVFTFDASGPKVEFVVLEFNVPFPEKIFKEMYSVQTR